MNLGKKYKQLFEGKTRSNDFTLLKENDISMTEIKEVIEEFTQNKNEKTKDIVSKEKINFFKES